MHLRLDANKYPAATALSVSSVVKIKVVGDKESAVETWFNTLQAVLQHEPWKAVPAGLLQELHTPPRSLDGGGAESSGPLNPSPARNGSNTHSSSGGNILLLDSNSDVFIDPGMVSQLQQLGYSEAQAREALRATHSAGVLQAANWLLDRPSGPVPPPPNNNIGISNNNGVSTRGYNEYSSGTGESMENTMQNPLAQPQWPPPAFRNSSPSPPQNPKQPSSTYPPLVSVGVARVLQQEEKRNAERDRILGEAFSDLDQLMAKAGEMVKLAEAFRVRASRATGAGDEEAQMDESLAAELADLGIASSITRESCGRLYYLELARQLAAVMEKPVVDAGGVLPLPEVYRRFNRARFTDLVSPDDLLQAVKKLPEVGTPLKLKEFRSGVKALVTSGSDEDSMLRKLVDLAIAGVVLAGDSTPRSDDLTSSVVQEFKESNISSSEVRVWTRTLGRGVTTAEAATALGVPVPVAGEHLSAAEASGLLCRDDGPEGLRFYKNFFAEVHFADDGDMMGLV